MNLIDYIIEGYTIVVPGHEFYRTIRNKYPEADVMLASSDGIGGNKLLIDMYCKELPSVKSATCALRSEDVVYEKFTRDFVNGERKSEEYFSEARKFANEFDIDINDLTMNELNEFSSIALEFIQLGKNLQHLSSKVKKRKK